ESLENASVKVNDYFDKLMKDGVDISCYTMMDVIEDTEYAREAMGYKKINLLSLSYGTRVALIYSYKYPDVINRSVMVGANPPGNFTWNPLETERAIDRYDSIYKAQNLTGYNGSIKQTMKTAFDKMPARWRGLKLDADKIKIGTFIAMYEVNNAVMAFDAYEKAAVKSDYSGLYALQLIFDFFAPKTIWGDMLLKGYSADFRPDTNYIAKYRAYSNTALGPNYSLLLWSISLKKHFPTIPEEYRSCRVSQTPTLVLSGSLDVSTPSVNAETQLMPFLPNGHLIKLENMSHADLLKAQMDSYRRCITTFFDTGVADASVFKTNEIDFKPKRNVGKIVKRFYPIVLIAKLFI
ncbi:MAG: alpha/beta fold hydrolase, partial [Bacteroidia bacterium]